MESSFSILNPVKTMMSRFFMVALITTCGVFSGRANTVVPPLKDKDVTLIPMGIVNNDMFFKFTLENEDEDKFMVILTDSDGTCLYKESVTGKFISKTFKAPAEMEPLFLTLFNVTDKSSQKFEISPERRYVEDISITNVH